MKVCVHTQHNSNEGTKVHNPRRIRCHVYCHNNWQAGVSQPSRHLARFFYIYSCIIYPALSVRHIYRNLSKCFYVNVNLRN